MARNNARHIVTGLEAKFDVHATTVADVWVDGEDLAAVLREIRSLTGESYRPSVYPIKSEGDNSVCIRLE